MGEIGKPSLRQQHVDHCLSFQPNGSLFGIGANVMDKMKLTNGANVFVFFQRRITRYFFNFVMVDIPVNRRHQQRLGKRCQVKSDQ